MDAYIYQADLYCAACIAKIKSSVKVPAKPGIESTYDSDEYPKGPYPGGGGEADCPNYCFGCGCFLENPLTLDGYEYVKKEVENYILSNECVYEWFDYYNLSIESQEN